MAPSATFTLPAAKPFTQRTVYFFAGQGLGIAGRTLREHAAVRVRADVPVTIENGPDESELLVLAGRPIDEPVAQYGPFVMNTAAEIQRAFSDYRASQFGGWPWPSDDPVHPRAAGRFARHVDGRVEEPP
jgi:hypothetical protein